MKKINFCVFALMLVFLSSFASAETVTSTNTGAYSVADTDVYILSLYSKGESVFTLPDVSINEGRKIVIRNVYSKAILSSSANIVSLTSIYPTNIIVSAIGGKWAELVSNGSYWIIMAAN